MVLFLDGGLSSTWLELFTCCARKKWGEGWEKERDREKSNSQKFPDFLSPNQSWGLFCPNSLRCNIPVYHINASLLIQRTYRFTYTIDIDLWIKLPSRTYRSWTHSCMQYHGFCSCSFWRNSRRKRAERHKLKDVWFVRLSRCILIFSKYSRYMWTIAGRMPPVP